MGLLHSVYPLTRAALVVLLAGASACSDSADSSASPEAPPQETSPASPVESLYGIGGDDPALFRRGLGARRYGRELTAALGALVATEMSRVQRITVQNDVWGLLDRLGPETSALTRAARAAVSRLALPATSFSSDAPPLPEPLTSFVEVATELPSLQHERVYGMRRIFSIALRHDEEVMERPNTRALFSRLVAIDGEGRRHQTAVVGEIEWLRFAEGELREARVWKLNRQSFELMSVSEVEHVPDAGADRFVFEFDEPQPLSDLPCIRCHDDDGTMSLPNRTLALDWRLQTLLAEEAP